MLKQVFPSSKQIAHPFSALHTVWEIIPRINAVNALFLPVVTVAVTVGTATTQQGAGEG